MNVHSWLPIALGVPGLVAQQPAPAGETARRGEGASWTAEEAMAWHCLERTALAQRRRPEYSLHATQLGRDLQGFRMHCFAAIGDEFVPETSWSPSDWVAYLVSDGAGADGALVFCLTSDGRLLVREGRGHYRPDGEPPAPGAAAGVHSKGTFADILGTPGKGLDGGFWRTGATLPRRQVRITFCDEHGLPYPDHRVALAPASWVTAKLSAPAGTELRRQSALLPAGWTSLDSTGAGTLAGVGVRDLVVCAGVPDDTMAPVPADAIRIDGDRLQVRMPAASLEFARRNTNESAAIALLKNISSAQAQCQASGVIDANGNGAGEYGFLAELAGTAPLRSDALGKVGTETIAPPVLHPRFGRVVGGRVVHRGYVFQMFLPDAAGKPVAEAGTGGGAGPRVDPARAEVLWCCYAWPVEYGVSGKRAFFVNQGGDVLSTDNAAGVYSGTTRPIVPTAAFAPDGQGALTDKVAANVVGMDGLTWVVVG